VDDWAAGYPEPSMKGASSKPAQEPRAWAPPPSPKTTIDEEGGAGGARSRWQLAACAAVAAVGTLGIGLGLSASGVPTVDVLRYVAYAAFALLLPGVLVWRAVGPACSGSLESLSAGFVVGLLIELVTGVALRALGATAMAWTIPIAVTVLASYGVVRRRSRKAAGSAPYRSEQLSVQDARQAHGVSSALILALTWAVAVLLPVAWLLVDVSPGNPVPMGSQEWFPRPDVTFHLALLRELEGAVPPDTPWVLGEPLLYHWFAYVHLSTAALLGDIDPIVLLLRLWFIPVLVATAALIGSSAVRASGLRAAGPIAALLAYGVVDPVPFRWIGVSSLHTSGLGDGVWYSPTQTYAMALLGLVLLLLTHLIRGWRPSWLGWALIILAIAALGGAKSVVLPILGAGLAFAVGRGLLWRSHQRETQVLIVIGAISGIAFAVASLVLYGTTAQGLSVGFGRVLLNQPFVANLATAAVDGSLGVAKTVVLAITGTVLALRLLPAVMAGRGAGRHDVLLWLLWGQVAAGAAASMLTFTPGGSQIFFLRTIAPALGILAGWGLARAWSDAGKLARWVTGAVSVCVGTSAAAAAAPVQRADATAGLRLLLGVIAAVILAGLFVALADLRAWSWFLGASAAMLAVSTGATLPAAVTSDTPVRFSGSGITTGTATALRWLDTHAGEDDLVATNRHCRGVIGDLCSADQFTVAAFSGRQLLVEGWAFTARANAQWSAKRRGATRTIAFWNPELLGANDAAFDPNTSSDQRSAALERLRTEYGVRWLVVQRDAVLVRDGRVPDPVTVDPVALFSGINIAQLGIATSDVAVYELVDR
jgi:hypothetical protein